MKSFTYYFFRVFSRVMSRMPFPVLYMVADLNRFMLQYIIQYRKKTILENLENSFPEKTPAEIRQIMNRFYRNLSDVAFEIIKMEHIRPDQLTGRFHFTGFDILEKSFRNNRSVIVAIGHCGNWEWMGTALGLLSDVKGYAIVKPLRNKHFHRYMELLRHRLNPDSTIPFRHTYRTMVRHNREYLTFNVIASDQTPMRDEINYWSNFLNQDTPFFMGVEKLARSLDFDVVFLDIRRTARGRYTGDIRLITDQPGATVPYEITEKYIRLLENAVRANPDNWLWSHRRWKHKRMPLQG